MKTKFEQLNTRYFWQNSIADWIKNSALICLFAFVCDAFLAKSGFFVGILGLISLGFLVYRNWEKNKSLRQIELTKFLNHQFSEFESSLELLHSKPKNRLEEIQKELIRTRFENQFPNVHLPRNDLYKSLSIAVLYLISAFFISVLANVIKVEISFDEAEKTALITDKIHPKLETISLEIIPPKYIQIPGFELKGNQVFNTNQTEIPANSLIHFAVGFSQTPISISWFDLVANSEESNTTNFSKIINNSSLFKIEATFSDTILKLEPIQLRVKKDISPIIIVEEPSENRSEISAPNQIKMESSISDDYGISAVKMKVTLARGTGENVRFRELSVPLKLNKKLPSSKVKISYLIKPLELEMQAGDELYFYIEAFDTKPNPNVTRSDTYFILWRDSTQQFTEITSKIALNLVPDFFRSQRQIVIDTEKLLNNRNRFSKKEFNSESQEIAYNQQLLRLRYGQYVGLEDEGMAESESQNEHEHEELDSDTGLEEEKSVTMAGIASDLVHKHEPAEMNTFLQDSPRNMLKKAIDAMWQSELNLRLFEPEKALPFEYEALKLLKEVQQSGRVYLRKSGTAVTPIVESEMRLKGDLKAIFEKNETINAENKTQELIRSLVLRLRNEKIHGELSELLIDDLKQSLSLFKTREEQVEWLNKLSKMETSFSSDLADELEQSLSSLMKEKMSILGQKTISKSEMEFLNTLQK